MFVIMLVMFVIFSPIGIKIADLEGELEDTAPMDHVGQLGRAQSDMTIMPKVFTSRGGGLNLTNKPRLTRQNRSIDPNKNPPLALTQTWLSKESGISLSMEEEVSFIGHITHTQYQYLQFMYIIVAIPVSFHFMFYFAIITVHVHTISQCCMFLTPFTSNAYYGFDTPVKTVNNIIICFV